MTPRSTGILRRASPYLLISLAVLVVFSHFWLSGSTLIGDSDRLNAFLNVRKFEIDSLRDLGRIPTWNERIFMGNSVAGLHYMWPGTGLFAYVESALPPEQLFRTMTFVTMLIIALAGIAAFAYFRDVCKSDFAAAVGAIVYCLSAYAIHRAAQLDSSAAVLIHIPIALLILRHATAQSLAVPFAALTLVIASLSLFTFLQEAAYALVLIGGYAVYRTLATRSFAPLMVLVLASLVALMAASPRVLTVLEDFRELDRTSELQGTSWLEIYRLFAEGIFGRFQGEGRALGNSTNLHEGLQVVGSSLAVLLAVATAISWTTRGERLAAFVLLVLLSLVLGVPFENWYRAIGIRRDGWSVELSVLVTNLMIALAIVGCRRLLKRTAPARMHRVFSPSDSSEAQEAVFFVVALSISLAVVLVNEVRYLLYLAFLKVDFTHARFSIASLIPISGLVAIGLSRMMASPAGPPEKLEPRVAIGCALAGVLAVWVIEGTPLASLAQAISARPIPVLWYRASPLEVARLLGWVLVFAVALLLLVRRGSLRPALRASIGVVLASAIIGETVAYAEFKLAGPQTFAQKVPFEDNNYLNVSSSDLRPPSPEAQKQLRLELQSDSFRSALVAPPSRFPAFVAPHLANFWDVRVVEGYSAGVPKRLASFEWPGSVRTLRALAFPSMSDVPWELLAYLNVRYGVSVGDDLYFNRPNKCSSSAIECVPRHRVIENPFEPLPRHFFVESIVPATVPLSEPEAGTVVSPPKGLSGTALPSGDILLTWSAPRRKEGAFRVEGREGEPSWPDGARGVYVQNVVGDKTEIALDAPARVIRIQLDRIDTLSLAEVRVYGRPLSATIPREQRTSANHGIKATAEVEIARGKASRQSSGTDYPASLAVDGRTRGSISSGSITQTASEDRPWWEVDLGGLYQVSRVEVWNPADCCRDSLRSYYVIAAREALPRSFTVPPYRELGEVGPSTRTFMKQQAVAGTTYFFRVQTCHGQVCSEHSAPVSVLAPDPQIPRPGGLRLKEKGAQSVELSWDGSPAARWYTIERRRGANEPFRQVSRTASTRFSLPFEGKDIVEALRVRACNEQGCSAHSDSVSVLETEGRTLARTSGVSPRLDLRAQSYVEGLGTTKQFSTEGTISVRYAGDRIDAMVDPSPHERFLVLNEMYHPRWRAYADGKEIAVHPVNTVMRGVLVPPGVSHVSVQFTPFVRTPLGYGIMAAALALLVATGVALARLQKTKAARLQADSERVLAALSLTSLVAFVSVPVRAIYYAMPLSPSNRAPVTLLFVLYLAIFGGLLASTDFLPYVMDGNETFSSLWHAANLHHFRISDSWGLADEAFSPDAAAHPYVHTHQGNFPRVFAYLLYVLGSRTAESQIAITTFSVGIAGILFVYFFFARIATAWFAFVVCMVFVTDYLLFAQWQVVTYRVWHVFLLFGCLLSIARLGESGRRSWWLATLLLFACLFYFELIFAAFVAGLCGLYAIARTFRRPARLAMIVAAQGLGAIAAVSAVLLQGSGYLGAENLRQDLYLTFLARNDFTSASGLLEAAASFYERNNVIFWHNIQEAGQFDTLSAFLHSFTWFDWQIHTPVFSMAVWIVVGGWLLGLARRPLSERPSSDLQMALALTIFTVGALLLFHGVAPPGSILDWIGLAAMSALAAAVCWSLIAAMARQSRFPRGAALAIIGTGVLAGAVGIAIPLWSSLFDETYRPIWSDMRHWSNTPFKGGAILLMATVVAGYVAIMGTRPILGPSRERRLLVVLLYLMCGAGAYVVVYKVSAGYIYSGYLARNAPFTVFLTDVVVACALYVAIMAARRAIADVRPIPREAPRQAVFLGYAQRSLAAVVVAFVVLLIGSWIAVQAYYVHRLPPTHYAFLKILREPPYLGATFVVDNYAAPVAAYTGAWAYMDPSISQAILEEESGKRILVGDRRYLWFADRDSNPAYRRPDYFVCMVPQSLSSLLARVLRDRGEGPGYPGCIARPLVKIAKGGQEPSNGFELMAYDRAGEQRIGFDSWAIVKLPLSGKDGGVTLEWRPAGTTRVEKRSASDPRTRDTIPAQR